MTGTGGSGAAAADADERALLGRHVDASLVDGARALFDDVYYRTRSGLAAASRYEALEHYLEFGWHERFDPHPLFDTHYYLRTHEQLSDSNDNPLLHYLSEGAAAGADPSPYFDTDYYYSQLDQYYSQPETPARHAVNALVHYVEYGPLGKACNPNPLFDNGYYLGVHSDVRSRGENPFAHFLQRGRLEGRPASPTHAQVMQALGGRQLLRGSWRSGHVLFFLQGSAGVDTALAARDTLANEHNVDGRVASSATRPGSLARSSRPGPSSWRTTETARTCCGPQRSGSSPSRSRRSQRASRSAMSSSSYLARAPPVSPSTSLCSTKRRPGQISTAPRISLRAWCSARANSFSASPGPQAPIR